MFIGVCVQSLLAPYERHLPATDAAPTELNAVLVGTSINIALLRSERSADLCRNACSAGCATRVKLSDSTCPKLWRTSVSRLWSPPVVSLRKLQPTRQSAKLRRIKPMKISATRAPFAFSVCFVLAALGIIAWLWPPAAPIKAQSEQRHLAGQDSAETQRKLPAEQLAVKTAPSL